MTVKCIQTSVVTCKVYSAYTKTCIKSREKNNMYTKQKKKKGVGGGGGQAVVMCNEHLVKRI